MATTRPFAYNTGSPISGTIQLGNLAIGTPTAGFPATGLTWFNGPDEDLGYIIGYYNGGQPTFWRSAAKTDQSFLDLFNAQSRRFGTSVVANATDVKSWLDANGYWTNWSSVVTSGLIMNLDAGDPASYPGSGNIWYDLSGNSYNGTLTNGATYSSSDGGSIVLDGTNDYINGASISSQLTGNITVEAWIKISAGPSDWVRIIGTGANPSGNRTFSLWYSNTRRLLWQRYGATDPGIQPANVLSYNTWYNIVATTSGNSHTVYINGASVGTATANGPWSASNESITLGSAVTIHAYLTGNMAVSRIYNRGLSSNEVLQNYNAIKSRFGL